MWVVREQILAPGVITTNYSYNSIAAAEKQFNLLRNNWQKKFKAHEIKLILIEDDKSILKTRSIPQSGVS